MSYIYIRRNFFQIATLFPVFIADMRRKEMYILTQKFFFFELICIFERGKTRFFIAYKRGSSRSFIILSLAFSYENIVVRDFGRKCFHNLDEPLLYTPEKNWVANI